MNIEKKVLKAIQELKPIPKWRFYLEGFFFKVLLGSLVFIAGIIFSILIYRAIEVVFDLKIYSDADFFLFFQIIAPLTLLFIITVTLFTFLKLYKNVNYKQDIFQIFLISIFLVLFTSFISFSIGLPEILDDTLVAKIPLNSSIRHEKIKHLHNPEKGFIVGEIESIKLDKYIIVKDFFNNFWELDIENLQDAKNHIGKTFKFVCKKKGSEKVLQAIEFRPWKYYNAILNF